jgi:hypothetical protein
VTATVSKSSLPPPSAQRPANTSIVAPFRLLSGDVQAHACLDSPEISSARCRGRPQGPVRPRPRTAPRTLHASRSRLGISESAGSCSAGSIARLPATPTPTTPSGNHHGPQSECRIETTAGTWPDRGWRRIRVLLRFRWRIEVGGGDHCSIPVEQGDCEIRRAPVIRTGRATTVAHTVVAPPSGASQLVTSVSELPTASAALIWGS